MLMIYSSEDQAGDRLCPICGRELQDSSFSNGVWLCTCGETIPEGLQVSPRMRPSNARFFTAEVESAIRQGLRVLRGKRTK